MTKKAAKVWLTLNDLVENLLMTRLGPGWELGRGVTLIKNVNGRGYMEPRAAIYEEVRHALETGEITAYAKISRPRPGELGYVEVHAAEWATLSFRDTKSGMRFESFSVRAHDADKLWLSRRDTVPRMPKMPRSPYPYLPALEIFIQNGGWPGITQGSAARKLAALYSRDPAIYKLRRQPSPETIERWVRDWSDFYKIERGSGSW